MTSVSPENNATRLGENHGYRFDGDFVYLNADVIFSDADLDADQAWALQLWACETGFPGAELSGVKVAEMTVLPMAGSIFAEACCAALPPAGAADQVLALALVSYAADGLPEVRDLAIYADPQSFFQPRFDGKLSCALIDGVAELKIDAICNPRAEDNLSGTLSLEVWALDAPYAGGGWTGCPVATAIIGVLGGGNEWTDCQFNVHAALPVEGAALTVMLREWTPAGYVTRDYRNFAATPAKAEEKAKPAAKAKPVAKPKAVVAAKPAAVAKAPVAEVKKPAAKAADVPAKKVVAAKAAAKAVSINKASEDELAALKGLPREVARAIVAGRPYASIEDVCKAKGMGLKKLAKLGDQLAL
jgi:DNA uptake protein ComE-like DNA-binding protein